MYLLFQVVYSILICWELTFSLQFGAETFDDKQERYIRRFNLHGKKYRNNLILKKIKNAWRKNATCMDGSEAKYYLSTSAGSNHWIIHLQGGGGCISFNDCQRRTKGPLGSSIGLNQKVTGEWTLSDDPAINPTFYKWNKVLVPYCSGDVFVGRKLRKDHPYNMHMLGHYILTAVIKELITKFKINSRETKILFGGTSAGGVGVIANIDHVAELVYPAKLRGYNDGGWFTLFPSYGEKQTGIPKFFYIMSEVFKNKWDGFVDKTCRKAMSTPAACLYGEIAIKYIKSPLFTMSFLWDSYQLTRMTSENHVIALPPLKSEEIHFLAKFGNHTFLSMKRIRSFKRHGVFAAACQSHTFLTNCIGGILCDFPQDVFYSSSGKSAYGALSEWYYTDGKKGSFIDDPGDYSSCSSGCCTAKCVKCKARTTKSKQRDSEENNKYNLNSISYKNNDREPKDSVEVISHQENIYVYYSISNKISPNWLCYIYTVILCYVYR